MPAASPARARVTRRPVSPARRRTDANVAPRKRAAVGLASVGRAPRRAGPARVVELGIAARAQLTRRNLVAGTLLALVGLVNVYSGLWVSGLSYELTHAHEVQGRLERELQDLKVEFATATAPGRLEKMAAERLGLKPPSAGQVVILP
jgi:cell division protein FtsL